MAKLKKPIIFQTTFTQYEAGEQVGEGGNGIVYRAIDMSRGEDVAIKLLDPRKAPSSEKGRRFKNELLFGTRNKHRNVINVTDHGLHTQGPQPAPFYVMPFYPGSLRTLMESVIGPNDVLPLFAQVLDGVEAAHFQGVIHRDLKPENILHDPKAKLIVVADFGVADFAQEELYTLVETKPGTRLANFQYAAPEQRERGGTCDQRTDIFALGLILNEMFTNAIPHGSGYRTIASTAPDFAWVDDLVAWMIRQNPAERPDTIEVIKRELIGRRNAFVEQQRVSALRSAVVPVTDIDDPIIADFRLES